MYRFNATLDFLSLYNVFSKICCLQSLGLNHLDPTSSLNTKVYFNSEELKFEEPHPIQLIAAVKKLQLIRWS